MIEKIQNVLFRFFVFSKGARLQFLSGLQVQARLGISTRDSMELQAKVTKDHQVRRLADMSLSSIQSGKGFASKYAQEGYFSDADARLLQAGDRLGVLSETIELMKKESSAEESFFSIAIFGNAQWIAGFIAILFLTMFATSYESLMTFGSSEPQTFFVIGNWLNSNLWWVLSIFGGLLAFYVVLRQRITQPAVRMTLRGVGVFAIYDQQQIIRICQLLQVLFAAGAPQEEAMDEVISIQPKSTFPGYVETALRKIQAALARGEAFAQVFADNLLDDAQSAMLLLQEGDGTPENLAKACGVLVETLRVSMKQQLAVTRGLVAGVFASAALVLLMPMINVLMGAGISSEI